MSKYLTLPNVSLAALLILGGVVYYTRQTLPPVVSERNRPLNLQADLLPVEQQTGVSVNVWCCTSTYQCVQETSDRANTACRDSQSAYLVRNDCENACHPAYEADPITPTGGERLVFCCEKGSAGEPTCAAEIATSKNPQPCGGGSEFASVKACAVSCTSGSAQ